MYDVNINTNTKRKDHLNPKLYVYHVNIKRVREKRDYSTLREFPSLYN